jgi:hypothetical protein
MCLVATSLALEDRQILSASAARLKQERGESELSPRHHERRNVQEEITQQPSVASEPVCGAIRPS